MYNSKQYIGVYSLCRKYYKQLKIYNGKRNRVARRAYLGNLIHSRSTTNRHTSNKSTFNENTSN